MKQNIVIIKCASHILDSIKNKHLRWFYAILISEMYKLKVNGKQKRNAPHITNLRYFMVLI